MPGKWQVKIVEALAHQSPLRLWALLACCEARSAAERAAVKRACATLVQQGRLERRAKGVYALVLDVAALLRAARGPPTGRGGTGAQSGAHRRRPR